MIIADYLILLVGKNPTPDFIAALNYSNNNTKIFLCYTKDTEKSISTLNVAKNIEKEILKIKNNISIEKVPVDKSEIRSIENTIKNNIVSKIDFSDNNKIILDCTGGTKMMSAIFYNKFYEINSKNIYFSYTSEKNNTTTLYNLIDNTKEINKNSDIAKKYTITERNILAIHGALEESDQNIEKDYENYFISNITNKDFILSLEFNLRNPVKKRKDLINSFFDINSLAEKIGGSYVSYVISSVFKLKNNNDNITEFVDEFYENISNITQLQDIKERIKLRILEENI